MTSEIRVLIADDHRLFCEGLKLVLNRDGISVVGQARTGRQTVEMVGELEPDVVLLDIRMPDMDGLQALAAIKSTNPEISVIILTSYNNPQYITRAISLGAAGYLMKDIDPIGVPQAVQSVVSGEAILDREILDMVVEQLSQATHPTDFTREIPSLTPQEVRILQLIAEGLDNNTIAEILSVSPNTVKTHVSNIFTKLGVSDRTQAAIWAIRRGIAVN
ncbi:MAG: response regulator transcription factor [Anaerolineales bacterium]|nr:response regulator transcription factor [Anaerolineales bacterium]